MSALERIYQQQQLLTETLQPVLQERHPDRRYALGGKNCSILWNPVASSAGAPVHTALRPIWYYVPDVAPLPGRDNQRSYIFWKEKIAPRVVIEMPFGAAPELYDRTPMRGKFWIYEQMLKVHYYIIFSPTTGQFDVYHYERATYQKLAPDEIGRYALTEPPAILGSWQGTYQETDGLWLRWWDENGEMFATPAESLDQERYLIEQERRRADRLAALLRTLNVQNMDRDEEE